MIDSHERKRRHDLIVETTTDYAVFTMSLDGIIESWNRGAERIFEYAEAEILGRHGSIVFTPEDVLQGAPEREMRLARETGRADDTRWHVRKTGTHFWASGVMMGLYDDAGQLYGLAKIVRDETDRKRNQDALHESEARLRLIATSVPQVIWTARADGAVDYITPRWTEYSGQPVEQALDWGWQEVLHPDDRPRTLEHWMHSVTTGDRYEIEYRLRRADGSYRWVLANGIPLRADGGQVTKWFGSVSDIHALKQAEEAMRAAQKLESIGVLAGGIAHDFNNLLTGILGNASLAVQALRRGAVAGIEPLIADVIRASERAGELTRQLLAYAGKGRVYVEAIDLCRLVSENRALIHASIPKHVAVTYDLAESCPRVEADRGQLQQLVMNLVLNAAEAIAEPGGTVHVQTRLLDLTADELATESMRQRFRGFTLEPGRYVCLEVRDTGHGMDTATRARIFDPFFTTKFLGRGLGLAAALGIVRGHRGALGVRSAPGEGSTFTVLLPTEPARGGPEEERPRGKVVEEFRGEGTVLVVDDEEPVRTMARRLLEELGYTVVLAVNGREALERFRTSPDRIRLVLLDLTMPVMNGEATFGELRRIDPDVRIILMSGYGDIEALRRVPSAVAQGFLAKPFTSEALTSVLRA